jgi:hypothetical protein
LFRGFDQILKFIWKKLKKEGSSLTDTVDNDQMMKMALDDMQNQWCNDIYLDMQIIKNSLFKIEELVDEIESGKKIKRAFIEEEVSGEELEMVIDGEYDHLVGEREVHGTSRSSLKEGFKYDKEEGDNVPERGLRSYRGHVKGKRLTDVNLD